MLVVADCYQRVQFQAYVFRERRLRLAHCYGSQILAGSLEARCNCAISSAIRPSAQGTKGHPYPSIDSQESALALSLHASNLNAHPPPRQKRFDPGQDHDIDSRRNVRQTYLQDSNDSNDSNAQYFEYA